MSKCACGEKTLGVLLGHSDGVPHEPYGEKCIDWENCGFIWGFKDE